MPIGNLLGGLDLGGMLNSVGGMNGLFNLTLGQMMEENEQGEGGRKPILIYLFEDITGQNIMQSFTTKDFSYLNVRHASIRQRLIKRIEEEGRE